MDGWRGFCGRRLQLPSLSSEFLPLFLNSLDIAGFKSFVRPVRLELPCGITALVGPNGSGKSNVVDAIRWCLGEQSARDLRGQRAQDVIFSGARRSLGMAEVTMAFEPSAGDDPAEHTPVLTRRLYRSGESEYLLDHQRVRLRDLTDAARALRIDSGHVVVNQGMADALLAATPFERRLVLETAAGLSAYRSKRDDARQKLVAAGQNVVTIEAVLAELEPRVRALRRQAKAVQERDEAAGQLRQALRAWYASRYSEAVAEQARLVRECAAITREREEATASLHRLEADARSQLEAERTWRLRVEDALAGLHRAEREHDSVSHLLQETRRTEASLHARITAIAGRQVQLEGSREEIEGRRDAVKARHDSIQAELEALRPAANELQDKYVLCRDDMNAVEVRERDAQETAREAAAHHDALVLELTNARTAHEECSRRHADAGQRLGELLVDLTAAGQLLSERLPRLQTLQEQRKVLEEERRIGENALAGCRSRLNRTDHICQRITRHLADVGRREAAVGRALAALETVLGRAGVEDLEVPAKWRRAAAAALAGWAGVTTHRAWSPEGRREWLRWRSALGEDGAGLLWASEVISGIRSDIHSPLDGTILTEGVDDAASLWSSLGDAPAHRIDSPPVQIVTRNGVILSALGVESGRADDRIERYFALGHELRRLRASQARWQLRLVAMSTVRQSAAQALVSQQRALVGCGERISAASAAEDRCRKGVRELEAALRRLETEREHWAQVSSELAARIGELSRAIGSTQGEIAGAATVRDAAAEDLVAARRQLDGARRRVGEAAEMLRQSERRIESLEVGAEAQSHILEAIVADLDRLEANARILDAEHADQESEAERQRERALELERRLAGAVSSVERQAYLLAEIRREPLALGGEIDLEAARLLLAGVVGRHERAIAQLERADLACGGLADEIRRDLGQEPDTLDAPDRSTPSDDELRRLRQRAAQYAEADSSVIGEYVSLDERLRKLRAHLEDINAAGEGLRAIMTDADHQMDRQFASAFREVDEEFGRVFEMMMRGGSAALELSGEDGGVDVRAQLPRRRQRSSAAFSGGERSLVATSLLFSILRIRPTPFCVLDEVDAALDETNVDRYLVALRDIASRTQVIVVTHNRATMAAADVLYGLTMDDDGASDLLSLRLDQYQVAG